LRCCCSEVKVKIRKGVGWCSTMILPKSKCEGRIC
jgi:hypothetical protein